MRIITATLLLSSSIAYGQISLEYNLANDTSNYAYLRAQREDNQVFLDIDSNNVRALIERASLNFQLTEYDKSIVDYTLLENLFPESSDPLTNRGFCYTYLGEYDMAIADFNAAIELDSMQALLYFNRAFGYSEAGLYESAVADLSRAIAIDPSYKKAYANRGFNYRKLNQYMNAVNDYNLAIAYQTNYIEAYLGRGDVYFDQQLYDKALVDYTAVKIMYPQITLPGFYIKMGISKMELNDYEGALQAFSTVIAIAPQFDSGYYYRALVEVHNGDYDSALADITNAIEIDPSNIEFYTERMEIYHSLGLSSEEKKDKRMIKTLGKK